MELERILAGRPVLRRLSDGGRSTIWLGAGDVALKVLHAGGPAGSLAHEVEALSRAAGEHVVELLDVSADDEAEVLVLRRLARGSLSDLLGARGGLDAGEAVTILVPVARALARMHAAGVAHAALGSADVLFSEDGAPVLCGFGSAALFAAGLPEVEREREPGVIADRAALAELAGLVLGRVSGPRAAAARALAGELTAQHVDLEERLVRGVFELAAARPVGFDVDREVHRAAPGRLGAPAKPGAGRGLGAAADEVVPGPVPAGWRERSAQLLAVGPAPLLREVRSSAGRRWERMPMARRRLMLGGAAAVVAALLVGALLPSGPEADPVRDPMAGDPSAAPDGSGAEPPVAEEPSEPDPVLALGELLERRAECFRTLSERCLAEVVEYGSSAELADRAALAAILDAGEQPAPIPAGDAVLIETLGDAALVELGPDSDPASVLLMRTEAGWRIRAYLTAARGGSDAEIG